MTLVIIEISMAFLEVSFQKNLYIFMGPTKERGVVVFEISMACDV